MLVHSISKRFTVFERIQVLHLLFVNNYAFLLLDSSGEPTVVRALHKRLISIFSKSTEASNPQKYTNVVLEGLYIITGNDVINYFRSAKNRVHATATAGDFTVTK